MRRAGAALMACVMGAALLSSVATPAAAANAAPRIVRALMLDWDSDQVADAVELHYSERIRHARDTDGRYPFRVEGFPIKVIRASTGTRKLVIVLKPHLTSDPGKSPVLSYSGTRDDPVRDLKGKQADEQVFRKVVALTDPDTTDTQRSVTVTVTGPGAVTSSPEGIACEPTCVAVFEVGTEVTFEATAEEGAQFESWSGSCAGAEVTCVITVDDDETVGATFVIVPEEEPGGGGLPLPLPSLSPLP